MIRHGKGSMDDVFLGEGMELDGTTLGAFVHTAHKALEEAFQFAGVSSESCVIDIGCGDGRAAIVAAERFQCKSVGGIDVGRELIEKFHIKAQSALERMKVRSSKDSDSASLSTLPRCFCVHGDALAWGRQSRMFLLPNEEHSFEAGSSTFSTDTPHGDGKQREDVFLPKPTHIYLYILQHMLRHLVPVLKRIRAEIPGVVIISAFEFKVRPEEPTGDEDSTAEDYLDVPVAAKFTESKERLTFRVYK